MNRNDKIIVALLFAGLMAWLWYSSRSSTERNRQQQQAAARAAAALSTNAAATAAIGAGSSAAPTNAAPQPPAPLPAATVHLADEQKVTLRTSDAEVLVTSRGATLLAATLPRYRARPERNSGPVVLDFDPQPALALSGLPGLPPDADYTLAAEPGGSNATLACRTPDGLAVERRIELLARYEIVVTDRISNSGTQPLVCGTNRVSLGTIYRGVSKNDEIAADSLAAAPDAKVQHWSSQIAGMVGGGCSGGAGGCGGGGGCGVGTPPPLTEREGAAPQRWVALKSRFFVEVLATSATNAGFRLEAVRDMATAGCPVARVGASVAFPGFTLAPGEGVERAYRLYVGPKKLAYLQALGEHRKYVMEFGFFRWFCEPLVPLLNFFHRLIPDYGVAIVLLTFLVRLVFWPLTHKSTQSMHRMRVVQPLIKALQEQFKDDPHKLQQETWRLYREHKVNQLSSCLPMLVQIPVFIALYTVLRSAVELRFAPFLWVKDLSEPENLFAHVLPLPLNVLPLLMASVTIWQSKLTPSMGDPMQQKLMTWMMPLMMLFFLYGMPAALSLYWTVSTLLAIVQMKWQLRSGLAAETAAAPAAPAEHLTRQQRRLQERQGK